MKMPSRHSPAQQGFALIEVLVSMLLFSLGVAGLIGMQARALQVSTDAQDRVQAAQLAQSLSSEMWVIKSTMLSDAAVAAWKSQIESSLPNGAGEITQNLIGTDATISVTWLAPSRKTAKSTIGNSADVASQFVTKVVIPQ